MQTRHHNSHQHDFLSHHQLREEYCIKHVVIGLPCLQCSFTRNRGAVRAGALANQRDGISTQPPDLRCSVRMASQLLPRAPHIQSAIVLSRWSCSPERVTRPEVSDLDPSGLGYVAVGGDATIAMLRQHKDGIIVLSSRLAAFVSLEVRRTGILTQRIPFQGVPSYPAMWLIYVHMEEPSLPVPVYNHHRTSSSSVLRRTISDLSILSNLLR